MARITIEKYIQQIDKYSSRYFRFPAFFPSCLRALLLSFVLHLSLFSSCSISPFFLSFCTVLCYDQEGQSENGHPIEMTAITTLKINALGAVTCIFAS
jgi:hypothetical protein